MNSLSHFEKKNMVSTILFGISTGVGIGLGFVFFFWAYDYIQEKLRR